MKVVKKGKTRAERAVVAAQKFSSRVVCGDCGSTLAFHANDLKTCSVPGAHKVICPVCKMIVTVSIGGLPKDVDTYVQMVANKELTPIENPVEG